MWYLIAGIISSVKLVADNFPSFSPDFITLVIAPMISGMKGVNFVA